MIRAGRIYSVYRSPLCSAYRKMHFPAPGSPRHSRMKEAGEGAPTKADEGWTKQVNRGTTASPRTYEHPNSVRPDDCSTLSGLEYLQADLCRSLGAVSTRSSAISDVVL